MAKVSCATGDKFTKKYLTLIYPVGWCSDRRSGKAHIFFSFPFTPTPEFVQRIKEWTKSAKFSTRDRNTFRTWIVCTKVPFFYLPIRRERERERERIETDRERVWHTDTTRTGCNPVVVDFCFLFSGGVQRCENRDATNYANARFDVRQRQYIDGSQ